MKKPAFCIFHNRPDKQPTWHHLDTRMPVTYATEREAQLEILEVWREHIDLMIEGTREFEEISFVDDWIEPVDVDAAGNVTDEDGNVFGKRED